VVTSIIIPQSDNPQSNPQPRVASIQVSNSFTWLTSHERRASARSKRSESTSSNSSTAPRSRASAKASAIRASVSPTQDDKRSDARLTATVLRPWYVIGPGHRWPLLLKPFYAIAELVPAWRGGARRLGLVTLDQMVRAIVRAVEQPPPSGTIRIVDVAGIAGS